MPGTLTGPVGLLTGDALLSWLHSGWLALKVVIGFSIIICVHELGHFLAAKWCGVRVDRFAVGFGYRLLGWRRGEGLTFGNRPEYSADELRQKGYGETDYCLKALPIGGYVRMLGQDDIIIDDRTGDVRLGDDPRSFTNRPIGQRMLVVSAGVVFNLLFAAVLLTCVFLIGREVESPCIMVPGDSPLSGKLISGDRILAINGSPVYSLRDIQIDPMFTTGPVRLRVERDGRPLEEEILAETVEAPQLRIRQLPVTGLITSRVAEDWDPVEVPAEQLPPGLARPPAESGARVRLPNVRAGDTIVRVDDRPCRSALDIIDAFQLSRGRIVKLTVERPDKARPDAPPQRVECYQRPKLVALPAAAEERSSGNIIDDSHILGLRRRPRLDSVLPGSPAQQGGLRGGDVIAEWGPVANPTYAEILESIRNNADKPIRVTVERDGQSIGPLSITPRTPLRLWGRADPKIRAAFDDFGEDQRPVVADVAPGTPAAELNLPRGSLILSIDDEPVNTWYDVVERLLASAGREVRVRYRSASNEAVETMRVPSSLINELDLPPNVFVLSIDGQERLEQSDPSGRTRSVPIANNSQAIAKLLSTRVGQTVRVGYRVGHSGQRYEKAFHVRADNLDPWQLRIFYAPDGRRLEIARERLSAGGNPLRALRMGVGEVVDWVKQVYIFLHMLLVRQNIGVEHVAGPVGILGAAVDKARAGLGELMYFLAFISVNLAVINFLPMPVMDGGLMLFLIIEKIKGRPLSLKTQMISTLVGLAAIILIGLFVTIQDITRLLPFD